MEQLNVYCDILAKIGKHRYHKEDNKPPEVVPHEFVTVKVVGVEVTSNVGTALRNEISRNLMRSFLDIKQVLTGGSFDVVDWEAIEHKMENTPEHHRA